MHKGMAEPSSKTDQEGYGTKQVVADLKIIKKKVDFFFFSSLFLPPFFSKIEAELNGLHYLLNLGGSSLDLGLKTVGNGRENTLTILVPVFFCRERERDRRTGKQKRYYGISETEYIGRENIGYDREVVTQIGNNTCNHSKHLTRHNSYNHTSFTCKIY